MHHGVAHRHGSEMFTVRVGASGTPTAYVPDIVLHDKDEQGRTVLIEPFDASIPRIGGTRIIATFRAEMKRNYYVIIIAKKQQLNKVLAEAYDVLLDFGDLDNLEKMLPRPAR
jgi:hypothetical protein